MSESKPNVYQRIAAVMHAVGYVKKDARVDGQYNAVTHDMVTALTRPHFLKNGVLILPTLVSGQVVDTGRKTSKGNPIIRYEGEYEIRFQNIDDKDDFFVERTSAHAEDQGDKAPGKALSYAVKGIVLKVLQLETGDADESRVPESGPEPLTEAEIDGLKKRLNTARSKVELREKLKEVFSVTEAAHDKAAHDALKAYGATLAKNLPEAMAA